MNYRNIELSDVPHLQKYLLRLETASCDYTTGGIVMWRKEFGIEICERENAIFLRQHICGAETCHLLPACDDVREGISAVIREEGNNARLWAVPEEYISVFDTLGIEYRLTELRDWFDYIYRADDLINLAGKGYKAQRNHINRFMQDMQSVVFEPITDDNTDAVLSFYERAFSDDLNPEDNSPRAEEARSVREVLMHREEYGFEGGVLRGNGEICGFTLGEVMGEMLYVHIEKADREINGAYPVLSRSFAEEMQKKHGITLINREDDAGDAGLRRAKEAYHPVRLLKKYLAELTV